MLDGGEAEGVPVTRGIKPHGNAGHAGTFMLQPLDSQIAHRVHHAAIWYIKFAS
jgi:hypothetical protein